MITRLYTIDGGRLDFDPSVPCLIATYTDFVMSKDFRNQGMQGLELITEKIKEHGKVAWISDLKKADVFASEDVQWANEYWNTNAYANGLRYCALVIPESAFGVIHLEEFMIEHERRKDPLIIKLFSNQESAREWVRSELA